MNLPTLTFESPWQLMWLAGLPVLWWIGRQPLRSLGTGRKVAALVFRTVVYVAIVAAIAGVQAVWTDSRMTVLYVLDQSESIPADRRQAMLDHVIAQVSRHRNAARGDRAGIVVFGRDAAIEVPPFDDDIPPLRRLEGMIGRTDATDLEAALNLAQASMPEDTARRIVVVTDGNENLGSARDTAGRLAAAGIGIDVVPVTTRATGEVVVEKVDLPPTVRKGQPFEARVVIDRQAAQGDGPARGTLRVKQVVGGAEQLLTEQSVELDAGTNVFPLRHTIDEPAAYTYRAEFVPDQASSDVDTLRQNNAASGYTYVAGSGRVLLITPAGPPQPGHQLLATTLRAVDIEVITMTTDRLFGSLAELQGYDAVILAGTPRVAGDTTASITSFSDEQIEMLVRNTQQLGAGLLMIGGPEALGAGGWTGTELEKAMPVDFRIRNRKVQAVGALALIMHASEMAQGNHWQKVIARASIEQLGSSDYAGVVHWSQAGDRWLWKHPTGMLPVGPNRKAMMAAMGRMSPGDMPQFDPAMRMAVAGLARTPAAVRHCIIISDGDPSPPAAGTIAAFKENQITISTVAVESHGLSDSQQLQQIASATGGKYYAVKSGKALPQIFQREARRVSRPLIFEPQGGVSPQIVFPHVVVDGLDSTLPPIRGFVQTQTKTSPLAQVVLVSPQPADAENATVLAVWNYGLGRSAVLTTDAGTRWAQSWTAWPGYEKLFSQLVRWLMRPTGDTGQFSLATNLRDGQIEVVLTGLDDEDNYLNFLDVGATVLDPDLKPLPLRMRQTAPGRYEGSVAADAAGTFFVNVVPGAGTAPLTAGVTVPFSDEFRVRPTNTALIGTLAALTPRGGQPGVVAPPLSGDQSSAVDPYRGGLPPARSIRDAWMWVLLAAATLFFLDVLVRRVAISAEPLRALARRLRGRPAVVDPTARLDQLRQLKSKTRQSLDAGRAAARFEPPGEVSPISVDRPAPSQAPVDEAKPEMSYTERLLEAKRRRRS